MMRRSRVLVVVLAGLAACRDDAGRGPDAAGTTGGDTDGDDDEAEDEADEADDDDGNDDGNDDDPSGPSTDPDDTGPDPDDTGPDPDTGPADTSSTGEPELPPMMSAVETKLIGVERSSPSGGPVHFSGSAQSAFPACEKCRS